MMTEEVKEEVKVSTKDDALVIINALNNGAKVM